MLGIFFLIASMIEMVGLVLPLKMLLSVAGEMSMKEANAC